MFRQTLASPQAAVTFLKATAASLTAMVALLAPSSASAQDLDVSSIAKDDVKKEASSSGSWLPSLGGSSSSGAPAVASASTSSAAWYDPLGLFTGESEPEQKPIRRNGTGVVATYQGSTLDRSARVEVTGGAWWDPLGLIYPAEETVVYEDVNGFLAQPRMDN